ncbi:hypothetical protein TTRE_0000069101 [Trichuris trichiura]|uniref:Uncharacterized protein n=1 Tax=Trichuris trichiura TaxID=36087 RepID=A0A077YWK6_TRITR|nr:hypothetical protein TTRE_0000069101 [Trichuris trichiura]
MNLRIMYGNSKERINPNQILLFVFISRRYETDSSHQYTPWSGFFQFSQCWVHLRENSTQCAYPQWIVSSLELHGSVDPGNGGKQFEVCAALTQTEAYWAKLQEVQGAIESYVEDEGALEKEVENAMAFETTVVDLGAKVQRYLHGSPKTTATPELRAAAPNLPKWNLPKFS